MSTSMSPELAATILKQIQEGKGHDADEVTAAENMAIALLRSLPRPRSTVLEERIACRKFWTEVLAKQGETCAWKRRKDGQYEASFARNAEAAWFAARGA